MAIGIGSVRRGMTEERMERVKEVHENWAAET